MTKVMTVSGGRGRTTHHSYARCSKVQGHTKLLSLYLKKNGGPATLGSPGDVGLGAWGAGDLCSYERQVSKGTNAVRKSSSKNVVFLFIRGLPNPPLWSAGVACCVGTLGQQVSELMPVQSNTQYSTVLLISYYCCHISKYDFSLV